MTHTASAATASADAIAWVRHLLAKGVQLWEIAGEAEYVVEYGGTAADWYRAYCADLLAACWEVALVDMAS